MDTPADNVQEVHTPDTQVTDIVQEAAEVNVTMEVVGAGEGVPPTEPIVAEPSNS